MTERLGLHACTNVFDEIHTILIGKILNSEERLLFFKFIFNLNLFILIGD